MNVLRRLIHFTRLGSEISFLFSHSREMSAGISARKAKRIALSSMKSSFASIVHAAISRNCNIYNISCATPATLRMDLDCVYPIWADIFSFSVEMFALPASTFVVRRSCWRGPNQTGVQNWIGSGVPNTDKRTRVELVWHAIAVQKKKRGSTAQKKSHLRSFRVVAPRISEGTQEKLRNYWRAANAPYRNEKRKK